MHSASQAPGSHPRTLLLVEDEGLIALATKRDLEARGYRVLLAGSGEEALALWRAGPRPDLVLMDIGLGRGMDGAETAECILKEGDVPIVFLSSHTEPEIVARTEGISSYGYVVKNSVITVLEASIKMAFKLFEANQEIKRSNSRLQATLEALPDLVFEVDLEGTYYAIHAPNPGLLLKPAEERIGRNLRDYLPPETVALIQEALEEARVKGISQGRRYDLDLPLGKRSFEIFASLMEGFGEPPHFTYLCRDITERHSLESELAQARRIVDKGTKDFRILTDNLPLFISYFNATTITYEYANAAFASQFNISPEKLVGRHLGEVLGQENLSFAMPYIEEARKGNSVSYVNSFNLKNGRRWARVNYVPVRDTTGKVASLLVFSFDVTDQKEAEESIRALLSEKELILREVNHRIKNNMTIISSLLSLQAAGLEEESAKAALRDAAGRVQSMMLLYDKLYQSGNFLALSAKTYLGTLVDDIFGNFSSGPDIRIEKDIGDFILDAKLLQSLGIILNELLTNVIKYAFQGRDGGRVRVAASLQNRILRLEVEDDGRGLPESLSLENPSSFGLMMVGVLTKQLDGRISREPGPGTRLALSFPAVDSPPPLVP